MLFNYTICSLILLFFHTDANQQFILYGQWHSQGVGDAQAQHGHTMFVRTSLF